MHETPYGYCRCGCGQKTTVAPETNRSVGRIKGRPAKFVHGHNMVGVRRRVGPDYLVDPETGCWVWQHGRISTGYGFTAVRGKQVLAHRAYYERHVGSIPEGLQIDHLCRNRRCVNPDHLEAVTSAENNRRAREALT